MAKPYESKPLRLPPRDSEFKRVDLELRGLDHSGPSYEGRVFFNRPDASLETPCEIDSGYAGSTWIFGHSHCWGDSGHCDAPESPLHGYDRRRPHPLLPEVHVIEVTAAIHQLAAGRQREFTVTVLPILRSRGESQVDPGLLSFQDLALVTYD